jgi:hypothetical protein
VPTCLQEVPGTGQPGARVATRAAKDGKPHVTMMPNRLAQ